MRAAGGDSDIEFLTGDDSLDILKRSNKYNRATFTKLVKLIKDHIDNERGTELIEKSFDKISKINDTLAENTAKFYCSRKTLLQKRL